MTAGALVGCGGGGDVPRERAGQDRAGSVVALRLVEAPTPLFDVPNYATKGTFAQVGGADGLDRVNAALRRVVISDQAAYEQSARDAGNEAARNAGNELRGSYETSVDPGLVSASSTVVSVLMPSIHRFPGGNHGAVVVSGTVQVPSGRRVGLAELFAEPVRALSVLEREFEESFRRQEPSRAVCLTGWPWLRPTARNYRHFALLEAGMALGFSRGNCQWLIATIPYDRLRPYFSPLAEQLVDGVLAPAA